MPQLEKCNFVFVAFLFFCNNTTVMAQAEDPGEPLYLTSLIKQEGHLKAQEAALVRDFFPLLSYSGFVTVNEEFKSNIFFWYFPAEESYDDPDNNDFPVILWNDGGAGVSAFFSLFSQNGPFIGGADGVNYTFNPFSWHKKYHMIYMDNPVDVGFSHTGSEEGYIRSGAEAAKDIYEFLSQFFALFPHLQRNPFYNSGASFGATYAIQTAALIHQKNLNSPTRFINLTGVIADSPWIDPYTQSHYGEYLFNAGLINENSRDEYITDENKIRNLIDVDKYLEASTTWSQITQVKTPSLVGYNALSHMLKDDLTLINMTEFAILNSTRKALHVGGLDFKFINFEQFSRTQPNFMRSSKPELDTLLEAGYQFLLYVGNMDGITNHLGVGQMLKTLSWPEGKDLIDGAREIWKANGRIAGYKTATANATMVIVRNAGHGCLGDYPEEVLNIVSSFIDNVTLSGRDQVSKEEL